MIKEWQKRKIIQDESVLLTHPSIIRYIAGHRGNRRQVVKVFLRNGKEEDELFFKTCCTVTENTQFEFVNVEKSKKIEGEVENLRLHEKKAPAVNKATRIQLNRIIEEHAEKIYAIYSHVVGMRIGKVRRVGDTIQEGPCIVLYCLDKTITPFGDKPLPDSIAGWPCDVREDFVMFGACPNKCSPFRQNFPDPGCSIGMPSDVDSGSVGFLFESRDLINTYGSGFLTASHVAIKRHNLELYKKEATFRSLGFKSDDHCIVHPSWEDNKRVDHTVGNVVQAYCGNYDYIEITEDKKRVLGLDFAVIQSNNFRQEGMCLV